MLLLLIFFFHMYKGSFGVIRDGLTHILIPNGWSWNGPASLYCPIWVEFKEDETEDWFKTTGSLQLAKKRKLEAPYSIVHLLFILIHWEDVLDNLFTPLPSLAHFVKKVPSSFGWCVCNFPLLQYISYIPLFDAWQVILFYDTNFY